jgi:DNA-binding MarR family transcriptional regulator
LHLASYWWKANENPWPSKGTIADYLNVDPRTVQRAIQKMEKLGYVHRIQRKAKAGDNLTNEYSLEGLVQALQPLAEQRLALKTSRAAEDKERRATPKAFALIAGGKGK